MLGAHHTPQVTARKLAEPERERSMQTMKTHEEIKAYVQATVAEQLPQIEPAGVRNWILARLIEPRPVRLAEDPDGKTFGEFWLVTDHVDGQHYRIAYASDDDAFGIAIPLASGVDWYMGTYGSFKEAVESM